MQCFSRPWLLALLLICGCQKPSGLVPVEGTVTLDGRTVSGMIISFDPHGETGGNGALGHVGDDGHFSLTDARGEPGAYVGEYRISFYPALKAGGVEGDPSDVVAAPRKAPLPDIYLNAGTSPVIATVPEGGGKIAVELTKTGQGAKATTTPKSAN